MLLSYKPDRETLMDAVLLKYVLKPGNVAELVQCAGPALTTPRGKPIST